MNGGTPAVTIRQDNRDGRLDLLTLADGRTVDLRYASGRLHEVQTAGGVTSYTHHPTYGQLTRVTSPDGQQVNLAWDGFRRVVDAETGVIAQELDYDAWGRVVMDTNP